MVSLFTMTGRKELFVRKYRLNIPEIWSENGWVDSRCRVRSFPLTVHNHVIRDES